MAYLGSDLIITLSWWTRVCLKENRPNTLDLNLIGCYKMILPLGWSLSGQNIWSGLLRPLARVIIKIEKSYERVGANLDSARKKHKQEILLEIKSLEEKSELLQLTEAEWKKRYQLENELQAIFVAEELYWQKGGGWEMDTKRRLQYLLFSINTQTGENENLWLHL